jgi:DNA sulfur modification protein DndD
MDAPLSTFDNDRIDAICAILPEIAEQVIIFIKDTEGDIAKKRLGNRIGAFYNLESLDVNETVVKKETV